MSMLSFIRRVLRKLLSTAGLTSRRAALARETQLRSKLYESQARLFDAQAVLASCARWVTAHSGTDRNLVTTIESLQAVEADLRRRLARAEHALDAERARKRPASRSAKEELTKEVAPTSSGPDDAWRDRFAASVLRSADPRALASSSPKRLVPPQRARLDPGELLDVWKPTPAATVSFVLATYNRLELLKLAVGSIRNQSLSVPHEIIVVDGGSTDGTIDWLVRQTDIISVIQHNRLPDESNRRRKSWGYFINLGFRLAEGKWICMISDDCLLLPGAVEAGLHRVEALEAEGCNVGAGAFYFRDWPKIERYFVQHTLGGMLMVNHGLFLKEALIDVGYAEEELYSFYKADSDLSLKLWDAGYEIVDCPQSFLEHLLLPSEELRLENNESLARDRCLMIERWTSRYIDPDVPEMFKLPYRHFSEFHDEGNTVRLFAPFLEGAENRRS